ncbi:hypothetical protein [Clostridium manihotivorum]|uniref:hypothetical protein n=1 Tax=Clostridium manihotivorum TaxID=2320868 RepID=UPI0013E312B5|nr:hypothetical protein [Clostridium manihotivorum]
MEAIITAVLLAIQTIAAIMDSIMVLLDVEQDLTIVAAILVEVITTILYFYYYY